jgi:hypothetical protein
MNFELKPTRQLVVRSRQLSVPVGPVLCLTFTLTTSQVAGHAIYAPISFREAPSFVQTCEMHSRCLQVC